MYKVKKVSSAWKLLKLTWRGGGGGSILGREEQFWTKKLIFFKRYTRFPGLNTQIRWLVPFLWGNFCDVISPKLEELKILHQECFVVIMTHAKFHFNWLMLTLIFGIWATEPPPPPRPLAWRKTENSRPDTVNRGKSSTFLTHISATAANYAAYQRKLFGSVAIMIAERTNFIVILRWNNLHNARK